MRKFLLTTVLALFTLPALADTLTLPSPVSCGTLKQCLNEPTGVPKTTVSVLGAPGYPFFYVYLNVTDDAGIVHQTEYKASQSSDGALVSVPMQSGFLQTQPDGSNKWIDTGSVIWFSGQFGSSLTCNALHRCTQHYTLSGGSVVR